MGNLNYIEILEADKDERKRRAEKAESALTAEKQAHAIAARNRDVYWNAYNDIEEAFGYNRGTTRITDNEMPTAIKEMREALEAEKQAYSETRRSRDDAHHVIVECGIGHKDLDNCGCEECERVRKGMQKAGYLSKPGETEGA